MKPLPILYALFAYLIGMGGLTFFILFAGGYSFMPVHVDLPQTMPIVGALLVDTLLITLFAVQHSVMARPAFKRWWTQWVPQHAERATYVLVSGLLMFLISFAWQPVDGLLWKTDSALLGTSLIALHLIGWSITVIATFLINHFELFGLQQAWEGATGKAVSEPAFTDRALYKLVRHPLQFGILLGIWIAPEMSAGHLLLSCLMTIYILIGLHFEEKDLVRKLGGDYLRYQERVPQLIPFSKGFAKQGDSKSAAAIAIK